MAKTKSAFFCSNCGNQSSKWLGKCSSCGEWNTYEEQVISSDKSSKKSSVLSETQKPILLKEIDASAVSRIVLDDTELNRVLGDGLVPGSVTLIGGEPGIGKSTLLLQLALFNKGLKILYVSGEESSQQIKTRADRIGAVAEQTHIYTETRVEVIIKESRNLNPNILIIDSIQTLSSEQIESAPGTVSQIRECTNHLIKYAKENNVPVFLIGHITKEGQIAGPKILEHMVDVVLNFEGDRNHFYRILRGVKNRFGSTNEIGIYQMVQEGLSIVENPSDVLLSDSNEDLSGVAVSASIEGIRPLMIETQALVSTAAYGTPQRSSTGFDLRRLNMLLAVLEKRCGFKIGMKDVFLNMAGGLKPEDTGIDLSVIVAILSSNLDIPVPKGFCFCGEVGLSGEIRAVKHVDQRIKEAKKLGFKTIFVSSFSPEEINASGIKVVKVGRIQELFQALFRG